MGYARSWIRLQVGLLGIFALDVRAAGRRRVRRVSAVGVLGARAAGRRRARRVSAVGVLGARAAGRRCARRVRSLVSWVRGPLARVLRYVAGNHCLTHQHTG